MTIASEISRQISNLKSDLVSILLDWVFMSFTFVILIVLFEVSTSFQYDDVSKLQLMVGYFIWRIAGGVIVETVQSIAIESKHGTLEQIILTGERLINVLFARGSFYTVSYTIRLLILGLFILPFLQTDSTYFGFNLVLIFILTILGVIGFALILCGVHLVTKAPSNLAFTISTALLLLSGAVSSNQGNFWLYQIGRVLPLGIGIELIKNYMETKLIDLNNIAALVTSTLVYIGLGVLAVYFAEKFAKRKGNLSQY